MISRRQLLRRSAVMLAIAPFFGGCQLLPGRIYPAYRYRLRVVVETPHGVHVGSSVIEVRQTRGSGPLGSVGASVRGEAAMVELPDNQYLFVLLRSHYSIDWASGVMFDVNDIPPIVVDGNWEDDTDRAFDAMLRNHGTHEVPRGMIEQSDNSLASNFPILVRFRDLRDPATVEEVDPDNLADTFGEGYRLRRITVELTDDAVTARIGERLPWLTNGRLNVPLAAIPDGGVLESEATLGQRLEHRDLKKDF